MSQGIMDQCSGNFKEMRVLIGMLDVSKASEVVIGRLQLVESLWRQLESGSLRLLSERRMGKTWALTLARAKTPEWAIPLFIDAEDIKNAPGFVMRINKELHRTGLVPPNCWDGMYDWFRRCGQRLQGKKIGLMEIPEIDPWSSFLEDTCRKLVHKSGGKKVVLMIDELPILLDKMIRAGRSEEAIDILNQLRALRQSLPSLRMVFCGSLGLHTVLQKLREWGYTGSPANDTHVLELPPLAPEDAYYLAGCLLLGEGIKCSDLEAVAGTIAEASSGVAFYIQHLVSWMRRQGSQTWTPQEVASVPEQFFNDPDGRDVFGYYDEHLGDHYPSDIVERARAALDVLSRYREGLSFNKLLNLVRHRPKTLTIDTETFLEGMYILSDDHYVIQQDDQWRFKLEIVRQWWFGTRGRLGL